jgi:hypothetical protein
LQACSIILMQTTCSEHGLQLKGMVPKRLPLLQLAVMNLGFHRPPILLISWLQIQGFP